MRRFQIHPGLQALACCAGCLLLIPRPGVAGELGAGISADDGEGSAYYFSVDYDWADGMAFGLQLGASRDGSGDSRIDSRAQSAWLQFSRDRWRLRTTLESFGDGDAIEVRQGTAQLSWDSGEWSAWGSGRLGQVQLFADPAAGGEPRVDVHSSGWEYGLAWWRDDGWYLQGAYGRSGYSRDLGQIVDDPATTVVFSSRTLGMAASLEDYHLSAAAGRLTDWGAVGLGLRQSDSALDGATARTWSVSADYLSGPAWRWRGEIGIQQDDLADDVYFVSLSFGYRFAP